jgi:hypothetical protein
MANADDYDTCLLRSAASRLSSHIAFKTAKVQAKPRPKTQEKYHIA